MQRYLFCLFWWAMLLSTCLAQDEEPVFSTEDALTTPEETPRRAESPTYPATAYWKITVSIALSKPAAGSHVQMLLPLSDGRQSVLSRHASVTGASYREEADGLNLWGHWFITDAAAAPTQLVYEYTVQIADARSKLPIAPFPPKGIAPEWRRYLFSSPLIQSDSARVRSRAKQLLRGKTTLGAVAHSLHAYVENLPAASDDGGKEDALSVLTAGRGNRTGKTRALVALLRAAGVPARVVGGIRLGDTTKKRTTISWVEALVGDRWVPMDPAGGHFAWLPNTYLALYRNDLPLLIHTRHAPVEYMFAIRQVTRSEALATEQPALPSHKRHRIGSRYESEHLHTIAAYVDHPIANVVLINDEAIPQSIVDQVVTTAQDSQINVALLSADIESSSLREHYLQSLISNNMTLIREATLFLIHSRDIDGLYALLKQGETGVQLNDLHIVLAGRFARPTALVLGSVLLRLLKPKALVLVQPEADLSRLWKIARAHLHERASLAESAAQQHTQAIVLTADTVARLSWWRRCVVGLWTVAVRSQVPLPALTLILALPLIAFFLVIIRNVIGLETFGTFSPMLLSLAFLTTGLGWGLLVFAIIVGLGTGLRLVLQRLQLHLVSRVAILIAVVAVSMVGLTVLGAALGIGALLHASIFPMVIMANTIENFTNTQLERGTGEALRLTFNTLLVATCAYIGIEETGLKPFVLAFPELLVGVIIIELLLGRWRGLRLVEYLRFYGVLRQQGAAPATELRRKASVG